MKPTAEELTRRASQTSCNLADVVAKIPLDDRDAVVEDVRAVLKTLDHAGFAETILYAAEFMIRVAKDNADNLDGIKAFSKVAAILIRSSALYIAMRQREEEGRG